jgi:hypothetical protein
MSRLVVPDMFSFIKSCYLTFNNGKIMAIHYFMRDAEEHAYLKAFYLIKCIQLIINSVVTNLIITVNDLLISAYEAVSYPARGSISIRNFVPSSKTAENQFVYKKIHFENM